ncbi:MAG: PKD domain-containing protein [Ferruginibacter sp.]|nr:PKD domain-containing protein [Ferruginibacter sp.]
MQYLFTILLLHLFATSNVFAQLQFIENKGQWNSKVNYQANFNTGAFFLENNGFTVLLNNTDEYKAIAQNAHGIKNVKSNTDTKDFTLNSFAYQVLFANANNTPNIFPDKSLPTYNNYFIGNDKNNWASNCKIYNAITYKNIYPNIDVRYYSTLNSLKYDFIVHPGGNPNDIVMQYKGGVKLSLKNNALIIGTTLGNVTELEPYTYQTNAVEQKNITTKYVINNNVVTFNISNYDLASTLIIDPQLIFSSFTGSTEDNWGFTATPGADGSFFAGGIVMGTGFPTSLGAFQTTYAGGVFDGWVNGFDMGIFKFSANGSQRIYATYIGGNGNEQPHSMIADANGNLIIAGRTNSTNYPILSSVPATGSQFDIVITKLNATGTAIIGSVRIGGSGDDGVNIKSKTLFSGDTSLRRNYGDDAKSEVILDASNNVILASSTQSTDFPAVNAFQPTLGGMQDGVILKLTPNLNSIIFSSFIGGSEDDACFVTAINPITNNIYIGGATKSNNMPGNTIGTINPNFVGRIDGFVTELQASGTAIFKTTYIGTSNVDAVYGLKFDRFGYPYIMGTTMGTMPVINALYFVAGAKQFVAKMQPDLSAFIYSTNFGTNSPSPNISPIAFLVDRCENVYVSGWGGSVNIGSGYTNSGTSGLPEINQIAGLPAADGSDFYFFVLRKNADAQLFGSHFGQNGAAGEHVDGGTSRFDANGIIYQAICANCLGFGPAAFPTFPPSSSPTPPWSSINPSPNCNLAAIKIDMNFAGVATTIQSSIAGIQNDTLGCVPTLIQFRDTLQKGVKYFWNFNSVAFPNATDLTTTVANAAHTFLAVGIYKVRLIAEDSLTCNIRDTSYITINISDRLATPKIIVKRNLPCNLKQYEFSNASFNTHAEAFNAQSFVWDYGDGSPKDTTNITPIRMHTYTGIGTYFVTLTVIDNRFCNSPISDTVKIIIKPDLLAKTQQEITGCSQTAVAFKNITQGGGLSWKWEFWNVTTNTIAATSTLFEPTFIFPADGDYKYRLIAFDSTTCNKTDTTQFYFISIIKAPRALFDYTPKPSLPNTPTNFINLSSFADKYLWNFGDGNSSTLFEPTHEYNKTGTYKVVLFAFNKSSCADTFSLVLDVIINPLLDVPNAFTPGKFGANGIVYVRGFGIEKMKWRIFNRWGEIVFESTNKNNGWNGFYKGKLQPTDVYTYTLDAEFVDGQTAQKTGDITLLR